MSDSIQLNAGAGAAMAAAMSHAAASAGPQTTVAVPAVAAAPQPPKESKAPPKFDPQKMLEQMQEIVDRLNAQMRESNRNLGFSVDHKINTFIVTVRDQNTGEVVRQIPNEVIVNFAHSLEDLKGLLFNEKL